MGHVFWNRSLGHWPLLQTDSLNGLVPSKECLGAQVNGLQPCDTGITQIFKLPLILERETFTTYPFPFYDNGFTILI